MGRDQTQYLPERPILSEHLVAGVNARNRGEDHQAKKVEELED